MKKKTHILICVNSPAERLEKSSLTAFELYCNKQSLLKLFWILADSEEGQLFSVVLENVKKEKTKWATDKKNRTVKM